MVKKLRNGENLLERDTLGLLRREQQSSNSCLCACGTVNSGGGVYSGSR